MFAMIYNLEIENILLSILIPIETGHNYTYIVIAYQIQTNQDNATRVRIIHGIYCNPSPD